jgi:hypothetical protein
MTQADLLEASAERRRALLLDPRDDVAAALETLAAGSRIDAGGGPLELLEPIPDGHKLALRDMAAGETVLLPVAVLASLAGVKLVRKVPVERLYAIVYALMIVAGGKLLLDGLGVG